MVVFKINKIFLVMIDSYHLKCYQTKILVLLIEQAQKASYDSPICKQRHGRSFIWRVWGFSGA